ncbi:uncharacterized protein F4817DRAFT_130607 [Daldinia loculata]|uniref:uncharacterized protein n=1 Tax=Daldinia loculata TaxID=103429 RepID=UPI0020C5A561|nr:uncharacterized protein F4817DRAFT_130607 [Daldinia loculata]KAI1651407.1 hypothetical protein F4817DRAFT_130607 [Daldinia loculata]
MDPLTAFGLSASIVQFIGFASGLISKSREIYNSSKGCTGEIETLDTVYGQLRNLSSSLETSFQRDLLIEEVKEREIVQHVLAISDLASTCKLNCDRLLETVRELKGRNGTHTRWKSFKLALKTVWKDNKIADLEQSLHHTQATLILHICAMTSYWQGVHQRQLDSLRTENYRMRSEQSSKLSDIAKVIIELRTRGIKSEHYDSLFTLDDIASLQTRISKLSISQKDAAKEHMIISSLSFDSRATRHCSIKEAHKKTLSWVFENTQARDSRAGSASGNLIRWLKNPDGIFWVSGKPGSGKSTLMKYISDHPTTIETLSQWAYPDPAIVACHYFWSAGTPMQKSYQGLLQTLLYDIFRQLPDLVETTCTERWSRSAEAMNHEPWTLPELSRVLQRITNRSDLGVKFCFFVDGLDEYEGDHLDFCQMLREISKSPYVKLCVSSRPWNIFEDSFGRDETRKLYMHDFTRPDIRSYVESRLQEHPRWQEVDAEAEDTNWLIEKITERAAGVFLWVCLVTRELRNGLTEYDSFSDMRRRLNNIPSDLEVFFKQILDSVEPFYHQKLATTLRIALAARQPASFLVYSFHDDEDEDPDYALKLPVESLSARRIEIKKKQISRRLNGRCRGLLEFNPNSGYVEFLHRTVMDYLRTQNTSTYLESKSPPGFNPTLSLLKATVAYIKSTKFPESIDRKQFATYTPSKLMFTLKEALAYAKQLGGSTITFDYIEELEHCIPDMHRKGQAKFNVWGHSSNQVHLFFREPAVEAGLDEYLCYILSKSPDYFIDFRGSDMERVSFLALSSALRPRWDELGGSFLSQQARRTNAIHYSRELAKVPRAWVILLEHALPSNPTPDSDNSQLAWHLQSGSISMMLKQGADPNAKTYHQTSPGYTVAWLRFTAASFSLSPGSFHQAKFIHALNSFISAGANMRALVSNPLGEGESSPIPGLDAFFNILLRKANDLDYFNIELLAIITETLMSRARATGMEIDSYWCIIEKAFPLETVSRIRKAFPSPKP